MWLASTNTNRLAYSSDGVTWAIAVADTVSEVLAIATLFIRPGQILEARKIRKKQRFISARVIAAYIPPRWSQIRLASEGLVDAIRAKLFPENSQVPTSSVLDANEDEDLLTPVNTSNWLSIFKRPEVLGFLALAVITLVNSRNRFGALVGGALPISPAGATDLWSTYFESWHQVGLGSASATPPWVAVTAIASLLVFGKVQLLITLFYLTAPLLIMWSGFNVLKRLTSTSWISTPAAFLYAISPVTVAAISALAKGGFFNQTICHRLTKIDSNFLHCGDPTATGMGGPNFEYENENLPDTASDNYPEGTVAIWNSKEITNGSQFFIVYADSTLPAICTRPVLDEFFSTPVNVSFWGG